MQPEAAIIRQATERDAPAMLRVYTPYVEKSTVSFESVPPTVDQFAARVSKYIAGWACFVAESRGQVVGYAYGSAHRERAAYKWSVETSVYVEQRAQGAGIGRKLYEALLPELTALGFCNAFAGVALPNPASVGLHQALGFRHIGTFPRVGYKFGNWCDVAWFHRVLSNGHPGDRLQREGAA